MKNGFNRFFFKKEPVEGFGMFRIFFGATSVLNAVLMIPGLHEFFGPRGMMEAHSPSTLAGINLFYFFPVTSLTLSLVFGLYMISSLTLMAGLFTRVSAALSFLSLCSLHDLNNLVLHSGDTAMRLVLFLLVFARSGDSFSLDRWFRRRGGGLKGPPRMQAPWAQRLIQIQTSFIYFSTAYYKFDGESWINGNSVYYTSRLWDFERFPVPILFNHLALMKPLTWISLLVEWSLGVLVWVPGLRVPVVIAGILLHLGIEWTMNIPAFEWVMMSLIFCMLSPREGRAAAYRMIELAGRMSSGVLDRVKK